MGDLPGENIALVGLLCTLARAHIVLRWYGSVRDLLAP